MCIINQIYIYTHNPSLDTETVCKDCAFVVLRSPEASWRAGASCKGQGHWTAQIRRETPEFSILDKTFPAVFLRHVKEP